MSLSRYGLPHTHPKVAATAELIDQRKAFMKEKNEKNKFIAALRRFAETGGKGFHDAVYNRPDFEPEHRGDRMLMLALAKHLDDPKIPGDQLGVSWFYYLPKMLVEAFEEFRLASKWSALREAYSLKMEGRGEVPDLVNVHVDGHHRHLAVTQVARVIAAVSGEAWLYEKLHAIFHAQQNCIDQAWERFVRVAYRELMPRIKVEAHRSNRGDFGKTTLLTYAMAGRVMFTFRRGNDEDDVQVTYVGDDSDMYGIRSGANIPSTPFMACIEMIHEVSDNWDLKKMKKDAEAGIGF